MYKLKKMNENYWKIETHGYFYRGSFKNVLMYCVKQLGFTLQELEFGVLDMSDKENSIANFGMNKMFIFSTHEKKELN